MNQPARTDAVVLKRFATNRAYTTLTVTSTLLRVAFEYAQVSPCAAFTMAWAISRSKPGKLTLRRARNQIRYKERLGSKCANSNLSH